MRHEVFASKFNNVTPEYIPSFEPNYSSLSNIHLYLFFGTDLDAGKRRCSEAIQLKIDKILMNLQNINFEQLSSRDIAAILCQTVSTIWLYQPFFDGNTKTMVTFLKIFLMSRGFDLSYEVSEQEEHDYKKFISLIYSDEDSVSLKSINILENYITKQDKSSVKI